MLLLEIVFVVLLSSLVFLVLRSIVEVESEYDSLISTGFLVGVALTSIVWGLGVGLYGR